MTTNAPHLQALQVTSHHNMTILTSPCSTERDNKRKTHEPASQQSHQISIGGAHPFDSKNQEQGVTLNKHATLALKAFTNEFDVAPDSLLGDQSVVEVNFGEDMGTRALHVNKKSKLTRVTSMPKLLSGLVGRRSSVSSLMATVELGHEVIKRLNVSVSAPSLPALTDTTQPKTPATTGFATTNPDKHLFTIFESEGMGSVQAIPSLETEDFFLEMKDDNIAAYGTEVISAIRQRDIPTLRRMHQEGRVLQCCNRFGESILHMACRCGFTDIVRFLVDEAGVSFRVCDDYGRTPLHDACWTQEPQTELVKMIVTACPDLLILKDKRGFTPLAYVRRDHWGQWCEFLEDNRKLLRPKELLLSSARQQ